MDKESLREMKSPSSKKEKEMILFGVWGEGVEFQGEIQWH